MSPTHAAEKTMDITFRTTRRLGIVLLSRGDSGGLGCWVGSVQESSPAADAGVRPGMVLLAVNGVSLQRATLDAAITLIRESERPIRLKFEQVDLLQWSRDALAHMLSDPTQLPFFFDYLTDKHGETGTAALQKEHAKVMFLNEIDGIRRATTLAERRAQLERIKQKFLSADAPWALRDIRGIRGRAVLAELSDAFNASGSMPSTGETMAFLDEAAMAIIDSLLSSFTEFAAGPFHVAMLKRLEARRGAGGEGEALDAILGDGDGWAMNSLKLYLLQARQHAALGLYLHLRATLAVAREALASTAGGGQDQSPQEQEGAETSGEGGARSESTDRARAKDAEVWAAIKRCHGKYLGDDAAMLVPCVPRTIRTAVRLCIEDRELGLLSAPAPRDRGDGSSGTLGAATAATAADPPSPAAVTAAAASVRLRATSSAGSSQGSDDDLEASWYYVDDRGRERGPCTTARIQSWVRRGYFLAPRKLRHALRSAPKQYCSLGCYDFPSDWFRRTDNLLAAAVGYLESIEAVVRERLACQVNTFLAVRSRMADTSARVKPAGQAQARSTVAATPVAIRDDGVDDDEDRAAASEAKTDDGGPGVITVVARAETASPGARVGVDADADAGAAAGAPAGAATSSMRSPGQHRPRVTSRVQKPFLPIGFTVHRSTKNGAVRAAAPQPSVAVAVAAAATSTSREAGGRSNTGGGSSMTRSSAAVDSMAHSREQALALRPACCVQLIEYVFDGGDDDDDDGNDDDDDDDDDDDGDTGVVGSASNAVRKDGTAAVTEGARIGPGLSSLRHRIRREMFCDDPSSGRVAPGRCVPVPEHTTAFLRMACEDRTPTEGGGPGGGGTLFNFMLTGADGTRLYAACAALEPHASDTAATSSASGTRTGRRSQVLLLLLTATPLFVAMRRELEALIVRHGSDGGSAVLSGVGGARVAPSDGQLQDALLRVARCGNDVGATLAVVAHGADLPATMLGRVDVPIAPLFGALHPRAVARVLQSLLTEQRVLLVAPRRTLLAAAAEGLRLLLSPLSWCHVYAPLLPPSMHTHLECPTPCILGALNRDLTFDERDRLVAPAGARRGGAGDLRTKLADMVVVWLDSGHVDLPEPASPLADCFVDLAEQWQEILWGGMHCNDYAASDRDVGPSEEASGRGVSLALRKAACVCIRALLDGAANHCVWLREQGDCVVVFDEHRFLDSRPARICEMAKQMVKTLAFSQFLLELE